MRQLAIFLDEYPDKTPFEALKYLTGECNYGGRVTDKCDRITIDVILNDFYSDRIFNDEYKFSPSGIYYAPPFGDMQSYVAYAQALPQYPEPEVFGFHENAAITKNLNETQAMLDAVLGTQQDGGGGDDGDADAKINGLADKILEDIAAPFDLEAAQKKYPVNYHQSMNSVFTQELTRFNGLIKVIRASLQELKKAIKGEALLNPQLEDALSSMLTNSIPAMWLAKSYPSLKKLGTYVKDLRERIDFFNNWLEHGMPATYVINKFYFTHGFLTGALQNYARKYGIPIDTMDFDYEVIKDEANAVSPDDGIHVTGMYMEACRWDDENFCLGESAPKVLFAVAPMIWIKPAKKEVIDTTGRYEMPMYKTMERKGTLATTGHSTNFVGFVALPSDVDVKHWIKRGAALMLSLSD